jgi:hypothetical protein
LVCHGLEVLVECIHTAIALENLSSLGILFLFRIIDFITIFFIGFAKHRGIDQLGCINYFDEWDQQAVQKRLVRRLEKLGYQVTLTPTDPAA